MTKIASMPEAEKIIAGQPQGVAPTGNDSLFCAVMEGFEVEIDGL